MIPFPPLGLYAITPDDMPADKLLKGVTRAIQGGASVVQYRDKSRSPAERVHLARDLATLCHRHGVPLIINDDAELAQKSGADGLHLGKGDTSLENARQKLGPHAIIGVSCYDSLERAKQAQDGGADYIAFGRFFPSHSKAQASQAPVELLTIARPHIRLPVVAIGGITAQNGAQLKQGGADLLAVIDAVLGQADPKTAAQEFMPLFDNTSSTKAPAGNT